MKILFSVIWFKFRNIQKINFYVYCFILFFIIVQIILFVNYFDEVFKTLGVNINNKIVLILNLFVIAFSFIIGLFTYSRDIKESTIFFMIPTAKIKIITYFYITAIANQLFLISCFFLFIFNLHYGNYKFTILSIITLIFSQILLSNISLIYSKKIKMLIAAPVISILLMFKYLLKGELNENIVLMMFFIVISIFSIFYTIKKKMYLYE